MRIHKKGSRAFRNFLIRINTGGFLPGVVKQHIEKRSLGTKMNYIILASVLPMLLILSVLFLYLYTQLNRQANLAIEEKMISARNVYNFYERNTRVYAQMLSENVQIKKELLAESVNVGNVLRICRQVQSSVLLNRITIHDRRGMVVVRSHAPGEFGDQQAGLTYVKNAIQSGKFTAHILTEGNNLILQNTVPITFDNDIIGSITAGYVLDHNFGKTMSELTRSGIFFAADGKITASSYSERLPLEPDYAFENRTWSVIKALSIPGLNAGKTLKLQHRYIPVITEKFPGSIAKAGIIVALEYSSWHTFLYILFWAMIVLSLLIILLGVVMSYQIGNKIAVYATSVSQAMLAFTRGEHDIRISRESDDELGEVATSFNEMAQTIQQNIRAIKQANETLEEKVEQRTADLQSALASITRLEELQQADYLLMSMLLKPLMSGSVQLKNLRAHYIIEQKKKYSFKGHQGDIGGDFCLLSTLKFQRQKDEWLFFFNGDAMGKSSQGASGAIICGTILQSILVPYKDQTRVKETPQLFLTNVYRELDQIFSLFKGSMYVSAVFGLVNSSTGTGFLLNAEHPLPVLYNGQKATFVLTRQSLPKLGFGPQGKKPAVGRFSLTPGSSLFCGSDGRDDLEIEGNIDNTEERFVSLILEAKGDLQKTRELIALAGRQMDDLSLLQIEFIG